MKINEIIAISGNSFEKLKNTELYNEVDRVYNRLKDVSDSAPALMATDVLGSELGEYRRVVAQLRKKWARCIYRMITHISELQKYGNTLINNVSTVSASCSIINA